MNDEDQFIKELRNLKLAPIPDDLRARLSEAPLAKSPKPRRLLYLAMVGAAAACIALLLQKETPVTPEEEAPIALNILHVDSTLLSSDTIEIKEIDGVLQEVVEEVWRDELFATNSTGLLAADSVVVRRKRINVPVDFL